MSTWSDPEVTHEVRDFYRSLDESGKEAFEAAVERLTEAGPTLGRPTVDEIKLRDYPQDIKVLFGAHLKELRAGTVRVLFTFGPDRVPVLLIGGDKEGSWTRWYRKAIIAAAYEYREYLKRTGLG